ncbi:hypothetical protein LOAG_15366 [Loa loa]|uniref:Uncharacterized protein n=1 Tax=Loa loa TaxID=7209 RepID=A0A1S0TFV4_LOALO|nr:hypothetical protein LOAG_15366 [Loa loa]EFO13164.2 hypothetical protein LOAG_15366 [Loa loa]
MIMNDYDDDVFIGVTSNLSTKMQNECLTSNLPGYICNSDILQFPVTNDKINFHNANMPDVSKELPNPITISTISNGSSDNSLVPVKFEV